MHPRNVWKYFTRQRAPRVSGSTAVYRELKLNFRRAGNARARIPQLSISGRRKRKGSAVHRPVQLQGKEVSLGRSCADCDRRLADRQVNRRYSIGIQRTNQFHSLKGAMFIPYSESKPSIKPLILRHRSLWERVHGSEKDSMSSQGPQGGILTYRAHLISF